MPPPEDLPASPSAASDATVALVSQLAHDLRNPLAGLRNAVRLLRSARDPKVAAQASEIIERLSMQLCHVVDDVVDMAALSRGRAELDMAPLDLRTVAHDAVALTAAGREERRQPLDYPPPADALPMQGDAALLTRTLVRLLARAGAVTARGERVALALERAPDGAHAVVHVRDRGPALDAGALATEPAAGAPLARSALSLVQRAVALHGGAISADGDAHGNVLTVTLPLAARSGARRVLVVDDERDSADVLAIMLARDGHAVRAVYRAGAVLPAAHAFRPDVVLLDIGLPDQDGLQVARALRADPLLAGVRIFAQSGYARKEDVQRARDAGVDEHLAKPIELDRLRALLQAVPAAAN